MPGMQLSDDGDSAARASLLNEAARMSIRHVSEHVALEHVDCEEMELTAISFFMHQVRNIRRLDGHAPRPASTRSHGRSGSSFLALV